jgi:hypothetical protein
VEEKPKYVEIEPRSRKELEEVFAGDDENAICNAMYSAAQHEPDWRWTQGELLKLLGYTSLLVRSSALVAIGEIATFSGNIDVEVVLPEIYKLANDPALGPFVEDCLADIRRCTKIQ